MRYLDFDLLIERLGEACRAKVLKSPAGEADGVFQLPFSPLEIENYLLKFGRSRRHVRHFDSSNIAAAISFGQRLFETVFKEKVREALYRSLDEAEHQQAGLRLRLRLTNAPDLADLPWEYLYNPSTSLFLCLSEQTPLVRYLDLPLHIRALAVTPPLKILVMISNPHHSPALAVEEEWRKLKEAVRELEHQKLAKLERLAHATLTDLQNHLGREEYHIFHFIGHGDFDPHTQEGGLIMEDEYQRPRLVSGKLLGTLLHDERTLRLAVLNACEGARGTRHDLFAGPAQRLMQHGIPAVLAMQFEITDEVAVTFAHDFYTALAHGQPLEAALVDTRKKIYAQGHELEWAAPVLYLRAPEGKIFDMETLPGASGLNAGAAPVRKPFLPLYFSFVRLSLLFYLNDFPEGFPGLNITALCRALGIKKRKFAVWALRKLAAEGLLQEIKVDKNVSWSISKTEREALHALMGGIGTRIHAPQGGN